ncbi:MAG TPA: galactose oxidase-like domain-containing protein [Sporichthya sp.]|nr:galactose oxidase-like domain-containing protein [Sporichthya sp.]
MRKPLLAVGAAALVVPLAPAAHATSAAETGLMSSLVSPSNGKNCSTSEKRQPDCNPTANAVNQLPDGRVLYWSGLEGWQGTNVYQWGSSGTNSQAAILDLRGKAPKFTFGLRPNTNPNGNDRDNAYFFNGALANNDVKSNDGDLFCGDFNFLPDGRLMLAGGQSLYQDPGVPGHPEMGVVELNGLRNTRIFNPRTNAWSDVGPMKYPRWYPTIVSQPDGTTLVFSGTHKLVKPIYTDRPADSYTNQPYVERFDPKTGKWTQLPASANKSLPLFARMTLLPDGRTLYNAAGQTFNTGDFKRDAATWHFVSAFDPRTNSWTDLGVNDLGGLPLGYRGNGASIMLPITPGDTSVRFLSLGGDWGTWPGSSFGVLPTTLTTVGVGNNNFSSGQAGSLHSGRWYSDAVLLPTGEVFTSSGATSSELHHPGLEIPNLSTELWDPNTKQWTVTAAQNNGRTYHSTAILLNDGRVLVGGHAPVPFMYSTPTDALTKFGFGSGYEDSTFQIFSPPNLFYGKRPVITGVNPLVKTGQTLTVKVDRPADISSVVLVRNPSVTHLQDGDQRNVVLEIVGRTAKAVQVKVPDNNYLPAGPYMLFANAKAAKGEVPSVSRQVFVGTALPAAQVAAMKQRQARLTAAELLAGVPAVPLTPDPNGSVPGAQLPGQDNALLPGSSARSVAGRRSGERRRRSCTLVRRTG